MPRYRGPKRDIDLALKSLGQEKRAKIIKSYRVILPSGVVEVESEEDIPFLKDYRVG